MVYQKFGPAEELTPFVECYFAWESSEPLEKELVNEEGKITEQENFFDPRDITNPGWR